jgi:hypothetical protein
MTDHPRDWSRRSVIAFLAGSTAWPWYRAALESKLNRSQPILVSLLETPRSAYTIGAMCLKSLSPNEKSIPQLTNTILASVGCDIEAMTTKQAVKSRIVNQVRADFAAGTVVSVDGWLLSMTEVRLYALVKLSLEMTG